TRDNNSENLQFCRRTKLLRQIGPKNPGFDRLIAQQGQSYCANPTILTKLLRQTSPFMPTRKSHFPASELDYPVRGCLMCAHTSSFCAGILSPGALTSSTYKFPVA